VINRVPVPTPRELEVLWYLGVGMHIDAPEKGHLTYFVRPWSTHDEDVARQHRAALHDRATTHRDLRAARHRQDDLRRGGAQLRSSSRSRRDSPASARRSSRSRRATPTSSTRSIRCSHGARLRHARRRLARLARAARLGAHRLHRHQTDIEAFGYGKGYKLADEYWRTILDGLTALQEKRGMVIICIAHAIDQEVRRAGYRGVRPLSDQAARARRGPRERVGRRDRLRAPRDDHRHAGQGTRRLAKGQTSGQRMLSVEERPAYQAKNRYGMPSEIPFPKVGAWDVFAQAVAGAYEVPPPKPALRTAELPLARKRSSLRSRRSRTTTRAHRQPRRSAVRGSRRRGAHARRSRRATH
jgi:hypothetical protein